jgi:O-antigen/teichoic acid export membrane protein
MKVDPLKQSAGRSVFCSAFMVMQAGLFARVLSLATLPVLSHALGPSAYGQAATIISMISIVTIMGIFGSDLSYTRFGLATNDADQAALDHFFWSLILGISLAVSAVAGLGLYFFNPTSSLGDMPITGFLVMAGVTAVTSSLAQTRARIQGRYTNIAFATLAGAVLGAATSIVLALCFNGGAWSLLWVGPVSAFASIAFLGTPSLFRLRNSARAQVKIKDLIGFGLASMVSAPVGWVIQSSDRLFLAAHEGMDTIGAYSVAASFSALGLIFSSGFTLVWFPEVTKLWEAKGEAAKKTVARLAGLWICLFLIAWVALSASGGDAIRLMTPTSFHRATSVIPLIAAAGLLYALAGMANTGLFLEKRMQNNIAGWIAAGLVAVIGFAIAIPHFGIMGAAVVQVLAYGTALLINAALAHRVVAFPLAYRSLILAGLIALTAVWVMSPPWHNDALLSLACKLPVGLGVAAAILFVVDCQAMLSGWKTLRLKIRT